ncbi:MAG: hypothetical protein J5I50_01580 [Chitinophagaceae bacterium]|nr:hypothetical protein [Chitinophagaceae bacterium]
MHFLKKILLPGSLLVFTLLFFTPDILAQRPVRTIRSNVLRPREGAAGAALNRTGQQRDTTAAARKIGFEHRDDLKDSVSISFRYPESLTKSNIDSSINDFRNYYSIPRGYQTIGNNGNAAYPIVFSPDKITGFDPGLHAFDVYKYTLENTKLYHTTKPFTTLNYLFDYLTKEQVASAMHTQNIRPNWNAGFDYRLISSPGVFQNQNTSHNNFRFFSSYQGRKKRYGAELILLTNKLISAENGGITDPLLLADPDRKRRIAVPVNLGNNSSSSFSVFSSGMSVGNRYSEFQVQLKQRYDFGKRDSVIINDSTKEYLFYPKLRFQHTFNYQDLSFRFEDNFTSSNSSVSDSVFFSDKYDIHIKPGAKNFYFQDKWSFISNDFSIRQFPETKNPAQFIDAGITLENYKGTFSKPYIQRNLIEIYPPAPVVKNFYNAIVHGEYRNKTRNRKWDASLTGAFHVAGHYAGDFRAGASLERFLNPAWGTIRVSFENINRSPAYIFNTNSAFNFDTASLTKQENITIFAFQASNKRFNLTIRNTSIANYAYFTNYYHPNQFSGLINLTQGILSTKNKIIGHLNLYSDFVIQQTATSGPVKVPLLFTRQRLAFEGNFFKNLNLSTGLDVSYNTPYKANHYSPIIGRFFAQDTTTISNLPTVDVYFNFRIRSLTMYVIAENLNTAQFNDGFAFTKNNFAAPYYPTPGLLFRLGVRWFMVN